MVGAVTVNEKMGSPLRSMSYWRKSHCYRAFGPMFVLRADFVTPSWNWAN